MNFRLTILFFFFTPLIFAQTNLVLNPSLEDTTTCDVYGSCPTGFSMICIATGWDRAKGSPDYFNACDSNMASVFGPDTGMVSVPQNAFGYQNSSTGNAYAGFYTYIGTSSINEREWLQCSLIYPLTIGTKYFIDLKVSLADSVNCASNNIGVLFSTVSLSYPVNDPQLNYSHFNYSNIITDTANWTIIAGQFIADSAYKYMLIGNFYDYAFTDSIYYPSRPVMNNIDSTRCFAYYYVDNIYVGTDSLTSIDNNEHNPFKIEIYPNPATNEFTISMTSPDKYVFDLFDLLGAKRLSARLDSSSKTVDLTSVDSGVYVFTIVDSKGDLIKTDKLIIIK